MGPDLGSLEIWIVRSRTPPVLQESISLFLFRDFITPIYANQCPVSLCFHECHSVRFVVYTNSIHYPKRYIGFISMSINLDEIFKHVPHWKSEPS